MLEKEKTFFECFETRIPYVKLEKFLTQEFENYDSLEFTFYQNEKNPNKKEVTVEKINVLFKAKEGALNIYTEEFDGSYESSALRRFMIKKFILHKSLYIDDGIECPDICEFSIDSTYIDRRKKKVIEGLEENFFILIHWGTPFKP